LALSFLTGVMAQHFLLSAAARSLSAAKIMRMSDRGVENVFLRLRWAATDGKPVCPGCGCMICCHVRFQGLRAQISTRFFSSRLPPLMQACAVEGGH